MNNLPNRPDLDREVREFEHMSYMEWPEDTPQTDINARVILVGLILGPMFIYATFKVLAAIVGFMWPVIQP